MENSKPTRFVREVMAIINVTPDSFSTGSGVVPALEELTEQCASALREGAAYLDIGGYSTRPGAEEVTIDEEWQRVERGLQAARRAMEQTNVKALLSVDTFRSEVAKRAIEGYDVAMINDVSGGRLDEAMWPLVARTGVKYVAMHMRGTPKTMQMMTRYDDVVGEVEYYFRQLLQEMTAAGISKEQITLDPGFGFAKDVAQNYLLVAGVERLNALGCRLLVGISRKSMLRSVVGARADDLLVANTALHWELLSRGASILRVHDVRAAVQTIALYNHYEQTIRR